MSVKTRDNSEISSFLRCPQGWLYDYIRCLRPKVDRLPLTAGTAGHTCVGMIHDGLEWEGKLAGWRAEQLKLIELAQDSQESAPDFTEEDVEKRYSALRACLSEYADYYPSSGMQALKHEIFFRWRPKAKLRTLCVGRVDGIMRNQDGQKWLLEIKTSSQRWDQNALTMDRQFALYTAAMKTSGHDVAGVYLVVLVLKTPSCPIVGVTKKTPAGRPTKNRQHITDRESLGEALAQTDVDVDDEWKALLEELPTRRDLLLQIDVLSYDAESLDRWIRRDLLVQLATLDQMQRQALKYDQLPRNPSQVNCRMCFHRTLCRAEFAGADTRQLVAERYVVSPTKRPYLPDDPGENPSLEASDANAGEA